MFFKSWPSIVQIYQHFFSLLATWMLNFVDHFSFWCGVYQSFLPSTQWHRPVWTYWNEITRTEHQRWTENFVSHRTKSCFYGWDLESISTVTDYRVFGKAKFRLRDLHHCMSITNFNVIASFIINCALKWSNKDSLFLILTCYIKINISIQYFVLNFKDSNSVNWRYL